MDQVRIQLEQNYRDLKTIDTLFENATKNYLHLNVRPNQTLCLALNLKFLVLDLKFRALNSKFLVLNSKFRVHTVVNFDV